MQVYTVINASLDFLCLSLSEINVDHEQDNINTK